MSLNLTLEAKVKSGSSVIGRTIKKVDEDFDVKIISNTRREEDKITRVNPPPERKIIQNDYLEFTGKSDNVIKLFNECEK